VIEYSAEGLREAGPHVAELTRVEGLHGHGEAARVRITRGGGDA
jgi:histidinol dehydrogenase